MEARWRLSKSAKKTQLSPGEFHEVSEAWTVAAKSRLLPTLRAPDNDKKFYLSLRETTASWVTTGADSVCGILDVATH